MRVNKFELADAVKRLSAIVPKTTTSEALQNILVDNGYLVANNMELSARIKLDGCEFERFLIPMKAFDMIGNLPNGDVELTGDENEIQIKAGKLKTRYKTTDPDLFPAIPKASGTTVRVDADRLLESINKVAFAVPKDNSNPAMKCFYIKYDKVRKCIDVVGLDGFCIAWDSISYDCNDTSFEMLISKESAMKLAGLGLSDETEISLSKSTAVFKTNDIEISCRLVDKTYFRYDQMFPNDHTYEATVKRSELLSALSRAKMCATADKQPVIVTLSDYDMVIQSKSVSSDYEERVQYAGTQGDGFQIAFNAAIVMSALKAFNSEEITLWFMNRKAPIAFRSADEDMKAIVLPVNFH